MKGSRFVCLSILYPLSISQRKRHTLLCDLGTFSLPNTHLLSIYQLNLLKNSFKVKIIYPFRASNYKKMIAMQNTFIKLIKFKELLLFCIKDTKEILGIFISFVLFTSSREINKTHPLFITSLGTYL